MSTITLEVRTSRILKDYQVTTRQDGSQYRSIMFNGAVDRGYRVAQEDGSMDYPTDFFAFRASGPLADTFNQYCNGRKDDGNGGQKLVSRRLLIEAEPETYQATRKTTVDGQVNIGGQLYNVSLPAELPETRTVFVVKSMKFLDANPANKGQAQAVQAAPAQAVATPVAQAVAAAPAAPAAQAVQAAPAQNAVPAAPVAAQNVGPAF